MLNKGTGASVFSCSWSRLKYKEGIQANSTGKARVCHFFVSLGIDRNDITTDKYDAVYFENHKFVLGFRFLGGLHAELTASANAVSTTHFHSEKSLTLLVH